MPNAAPYKIEKRGDKFVVLNNLGDVKAKFDTAAKAQAYLDALYANVPGAAKKAAKTPFTGHLKRAKSSEELAARWAPTLGNGRRQSADEGLPSITDAESLKAAIAEAGYVQQREYVILRAQELGLSDLIPKEWLGDQAVVDPAVTTKAERDFAEPLADSAPVEIAPADESEGLLPQAVDAHPAGDAPAELVTPGLTGTTSIGVPGMAGTLYVGDIPQVSGYMTTTTTGGTLTASSLKGMLSPAYTSPRVAPVPEAPVSTVETSRAFTTEVNGKTLLTAPADAFKTQKADAGNKHFLWMSGRFVGAEEPNRNNAFWSAGDLELGNATVANGPLNWLHEARHVIGTIAKADYVRPPVQQAAESTQPHIVATSAVWGWIYPDEAWVIEQASDAQKLWYSMECISDSVKCRADGCGQEVAYGAYLNDLGCSHMTQRSSVRHFANPTFLGGAVIVPPARPGWADADASIMTQAASMAEKAFDQAGHPDMAASEWELLMGQVLAYART